MAMEIKGVSTQFPLSPVQRVKSTQVASPSQEAVNIKESAEVRIAASEEPLDTKKLDALRSKIESGSYSIDSGRIAKSILKNG